MERALRALAAFRRPLYITTTILVLVFQAYWLHKNYVLHRQDLLNRVELEMRTQLVSLDIKRISSADANASLRDSIKAITERLSGQSRNNNTITVHPIVISNVSQLDNAMSDNLLSSIGNVDYSEALYKQLKQHIPELKGDEHIEIYYYHGDNASAYPGTKNITSHNSTGLVEATFKPGNGYKAHIDNLQWIILKAIALPIFISVIYVVIFLVTITALVQTATLNNALLLSKEIFSQNMTHELKMPVATLSLATEALDKYGSVSLQSEINEYTGVMKKSIAQLSVIIDNILANARLRHNRVTINRSVLPVITLIEEVLQGMQPQLAKTGTRVIYTNVAAEARLFADKEQMKHVLSNLIDNAIKYAERQPVININFRKDGKNCRLIIQDNGHGIPKKYFTEVFQPYFRVPENNLHTVKGFGLGLSFVRQVIQLHNGKINITQSNGNGTTMEIDLPNK